MTCCHASCDDLAVWRITPEDNVYLEACVGHVGELLLGGYVLRVEWIGERVVA